MRTDRVLSGRVLFLPGNVPSKKNSKRIVINRVTGKPFIISSVTAINYRKHYGIFYRSLKAKFLAELRSRCTDGIIYVGMYFVRKDKGKFDYNNISQSVCDLMVENEWVGDDCASVMAPVFLGYCVSKIDPGVYIILMDREYEGLMGRTITKMGLQKDFE